MPTWERQCPSFSSSLLDAIYRSTDETSDHHQHHRRNNVEEDIQSLRRAIMIEKWMENYTARSTPRHFPSNSGSSTDSSVFSSSETDSSPKSSLQHQKQTPPADRPATKTKSRAQKIFGDLKKVKEPISPGGKISNFFNSIFSPRNLKSNQGAVVDEWSSMRKSRSMKDTTATACSMAAASRSCLSKTASSRGSKSKRSVRFCPVSVIVDQDCQPCGHKSIYNDEPTLTLSPPEFIKKNIDSFRAFDGKNVRKHELRDSEQDLDGMSCASSDLFELENIGRIEYEEELPVYESTSLQMNQTISGGIVII